jgi:3-methyladenine DNA glycosylase/8-oxoguanine DNA glycosylase
MPASGATRPVPVQYGPGIDRGEEAYVAIRVFEPTKAIRSLSRTDPRFRRLVRDVGPMRVVLRPSTFESLSRAIVYQQLTGHAAGTIWSRLVAQFDGSRMTAGAVARRRVPQLREAGLSRAKAEAIKDLARHVTSGRLRPRGLHHLEDEAVIETLTQVRGIGPWSARMHLMFSLGRPDVWPVGDLGVRKGVARFLGRGVPDAKQTEALADAFRPHRSVLAWYCWRILELDEWSP